LRRRILKRKKRTGEENYEEQQDEGTYEGKLNVTELKGNVKNKRKENEDV
jgi:hypothetical protein